MRERILTGLEFMGMRLDRERNRAILAEGRISGEGSGVEVWMIPTDEELQMAREARELLA